jgi:wyosine [tRNA(Phe)-imidazoG37] synthetase (radical SAM superfamily)
MTTRLPADQCVYGPVPSRRLGRSLGVDLVPLKTCTFDCVYCQLGPTTDKTVRRQRWLEPAGVVARVRERLGSEPDVISLAGSGEPTLYDGIGEVITGIKEITGTPVAVITNGSLLSLPEARRDLAAADIVVPSLDAPDSVLFERVNRPHADLSFTEIVDGMVAFRESFEGQLWLEVMLLGGLTGVPEVVRRLAEIAARIAPDRVQLNTAVRPPSEPTIQAVTPDEMVSFAALFTPVAEVIARSALAVDDLDAGPDEVLALVSRRPCTMADIASGLGIHHGEALKLVVALTETGAIETSTHDDRRFYAATAPVTHSLTEEAP